VLCTSHSNRTSTFGCLPARAIAELFPTQCWSVGCHNRRSLHSQGLLVPHDVNGTPRARLKGKGQNRLGPSAHLTPRCVKFIAADSPSCVLPSARTDTLVMSASSTSVSVKLDEAMAMWSPT